MLSMGLSGNFTGVRVSGTDVFLSYARQDRPTARLFAESLADEGFGVWWDASLHSGETFDEVIEQRLRDAKAVVVLWSPRSVASRWVRAEATLADRGNKLVPAIIEPCDRPIIFELTHAAELSDWTGDIADARWQTFVSDLRRLVGAGSGAKEATAKQPAAAEPPKVRAVEEHPKAASAPSQEARHHANDGVNHVHDGEVHCLEMEPGELIGDPILVNSSGLKFGRSSPADIVLPHKSISREHCIIGLANDELLVTDLNSTNGTYIDGVRISRATVLPIGSVLQLGQVTLKHVVRMGSEAKTGGEIRNAAAGGVAGSGRLAAAS